MGMASDDCGTNKQYDIWRLVHAFRMKFLHVNEINLNGEKFMLSYQMTVFVCTQEDEPRATAAVAR